MTKAADLRNLAGALDVDGSAFAVDGKSLELDGGRNVQWGGTYADGYPTVWGHSSNKEVRIAPNGANSGIVVLMSATGMDVTGNLTVSGDMTISGNTTFVNSNNLEVEDLNITLASGSTSSAASDGAGFTIDGANASISWNSSNDRFDISDNVYVSGAGGSGSVSKVSVLNPDDGAGHSGATAEIGSELWGEAYLRVGNLDLRASGGDIRYNTAGLDMQFKTTANTGFMFGSTWVTPPEKFYVGANARIDGTVTAQDAFKTDQVRHSVRPSVLMDFANSKKLHPSIAFTRSTTASYYDGKSKVKAEENILIRSQEVDAWSKTNTTVTSNDTTAPDGTQTADKLQSMNNGTGTYRTYKNVNAPEATYTFSFYMKKGNMRYGWMAAGVNSGTKQYVIIDFDSNGVVQDYTPSLTNVKSQDVGNGWYRVSATSTAHTSGSVYVYGYLSEGATVSSTTLDGDGTQYTYFWGAQIEQRDSLSAYTPTTNAKIIKYQPQLQVAEANKPRFDHNPETGESKGLMIEETAINYMSYSVPAASRFSGGVIMYDNYAIAPDGTLSAAHCQMTSSGSYTQTTQSVGSSSAKEYTFSFYIKQQGDNCSGVRMYYHESSPSNRIEATFNFDGTISGKVNTGTVASNPSMATIEPVGNGWYRCSLSSTSDGSGSTFVVNLRSANTGTYNTSNTFLLWGLQLEHSKYNHAPTSYIATNGSQASRSPEVASITGDVFSETVSSQDITVYSHSIVSENYSWKNLNSTVYNFGPDRVQFRIDDTNGPEALVFSPSFVAQVSGFNTSEREHKAAVTYQINNVRMSQNGSTVSADTNADWDPFTYMNLGRLESTEYLDGIIKKIAIYDSILSDAELQALTENN